MSLAVVSRIQPADAAILARAQARLDRLTKPRGSLGRLEWIAARLCAIQGTLSPRTTPRRVVVFAADHGVTAEGVSAYPQAVTAQMAGNFLRGGAAINAIARAAGADVWVVDVGVAGEIDGAGSSAALLRRKVMAGSRNMVEGPAMSRDQLTQAMAAGFEVAEAAARDSVALLACGDMGIGNTTAASAMTAALTGSSIADVTGRGTGLDDDALARKVAVVTRALDINRPGRDPLAVLSAVGGLEIAAITGAYLGAAAHRIAIVGDGFISTAAALAAAALAPAFRDYWFAGHLSSEPGHAIQLRHLQQAPLLDLQLRLGEGTGAALAMPLFDAAVEVLTRMATFESAAVSGLPAELDHVSDVNRPPTAQGGL